MQPTAPLASAAAYTARVVGGGVTDLAGNPLAGDVISTFTTQLGSVVEYDGARLRRARAPPRPGIYLAQTADGELTLLPSVASEFDGQLCQADGRPPRGPARARSAWPVAP